MEKVVIYTSNFCGYCLKAKHLFGLKGVSYKELRVDENQQHLEDSVKKSGGLKTVPQIFIDDYHVGGCDELYALEKAGKLDQMIAKELA